ncbi:MAG: sigma 54-interacting transcriptional regulator [Planctomycetota bacterium]
MGEITKRFYQARDHANAIAAKKSAARDALEELLDKAIAAVKARHGFIIISEPKNPYAIHYARSVGKEEISLDLKVVSKELLKNAFEMGEAVVSQDPWEVLECTRGTVTVDTNTYKAVPELKSVIVVPLAAEGRKVGALVLHEHGNDKRFDLEDRRILEPLANLAATVVDRIAQQLRESVAPRLARTKRPEERAPGLVGDDPVFVEAVEKARKAGPIDATVLIYGEMGTGKEAIAELIHASSRRAKGKLIKVNMGQFSRELIASELFGYRKGAFTGATADHKGLAELADGGTLFLDEMGLADEHSQGILLRLIQDKVIRPVGGVERQIDVRFVVATNRNLDELVAQKLFMPDLFYRLAQLRVTLPPLRERLKDLPLLVPALVAKIEFKYRVPSRPLSQAAMERLERHDWTGNVRELENVLLEALTFTDSKKQYVDEKDLPIQQKAVVEEPGTGKLTADLWGYIRAAEHFRAHPDHLEKDEPWTLANLSRASYYRFMKAGKGWDTAGRLLQSYESLGLPSPPTL